MRFYLSLLLTLFIGFQSMPASAQKHKMCSGKEVFLEDFDRKHLENELCFPWYASGYDIYKPDKATIAELQKFKGHISVNIVAGSWCDDTKNLLPSFYKVADAAGIPDRKISLTGVDREKKNADGEHVLGATIIPAFIFYYDDVEIGRIVELVRQPIEKEILAIYKSHLHKP